MLHESTDPVKNIVLNFTLGKVCFMMNRYEDALSYFTKVYEFTGEDRIIVKYRQKSLANKAMCKCMSGNYKQALDLCD